MDLERRLLEKKDDLATLKGSVIVAGGNSDDLIDAAKPGFFEGWPQEQGEYRFMQFYLPAFKRAFLVFGNADQYSHAGIAEGFFTFCGFKYGTDVVRPEGYDITVVHAKGNHCKLVGAGFCDIGDGKAIFKEKSKSYNIGPDKTHISQIASREDVPYQVFFK